MVHRFLSIAFSIATLIVQGQILTIQSDSKGVTIREGADTVLYYHLQTNSKEGLAPRSNYIHPLYNLNGTILTEDFPEDHIHHRGIFWAWHQVLIDGKSVMDTWDCSMIQWDSELFKKELLENGAISFDIHSQWLSISGDDKKRKRPILEEATQVTVHPKVRNHRVIDISISLLALTDKLQIGGSQDEKGYGGFSARIRPPQDLTFHSGNEQILPEKNQVRASSWMQFHGSFDPEGPQSGLIIVQHPDNPGEDNLWILRSKGSMQNAVFPGKEPYSIAQDKSTLLQYRLIIYEGNFGAGEIASFIPF